MADRRMFSKRVIDSARFLKMPCSTQLLYFHLGLHADDDGIVEAYTIMNSTGCTEDDLKILVAKGFVYVLNEDLVSYITDWRENNKLRADRKTDSIYQDLLLQILPDVEILHPTQRADAKKAKKPQPQHFPWPSNGQPVDGIGKDRIGKDRIGKDNNPYAHLHEHFESFWKAYPKKKDKQNALKAFKKINPDETLLSTMLEAIKQQSNTSQWQRDGGQYIPYPASWLNGKRWEDEQDKPIKSSSSKPDYYDASRYENVVEEMRHIMEV